MELQHKTFELPNFLNPRNIKMCQNCVSNEESVRAVYAFCTRADTVIRV